MILYVQLATYQGGGSYQNLHYMQNISTLILNELKTNLWIDRATRYNTENKWSRKEDTDRRKGNGRRCCLGDRIYSIPCRSSCFPPGRFWRIWWIHPFFQTILVQFIQFFNSSYCKAASAARNWTDYVPQTAATTLAFLPVFNLLLYQTYVLWMQFYLPFTKSAPLQVWMQTYSRCKYIYPFTSLLLCRQMQTYSGCKSVVPFYQSALVQTNANILRM